MSSWPDALPLGATDETPSPALDALIRGPGAALAAVLLLGSADPARAEWSRHAAMRLARAWVRTGRGVALADLDFESPRLHELLSVPNEQGVSDHFEFGSSLGPLALPVEDASWGLIPAGPYVPDPAGLLRSPEWPRVLRDLAEGDAVLLCYLPGNAPGVAELAGVVGAVIDLGAGEVAGIHPMWVLASFEEPSAESLEPSFAEPRAESLEPRAEEPTAELEPRPAPATHKPVIGSARALSAEDEAFERIRLPKDARTREALIADLRIRQRDALMSPPADVYRPSLAEAPAASAPEPDLAAPVGPPAPPAVPPAGEVAAAGMAAAAEVPAVATSPAVPVPEPPIFRVTAAQPTPRTRLHPLWWTLVVVLLLSVLAGGWHFLGGWLDARRAREEAAREARTPVRQPVAIPKPAALDTVLGWAVAVEAHQQLPTAQTRIAALGRALPTPGFFIAPLVREDVLYYHVLAGPVRDSTAAALLMDTLIARRQKTGSTPGDIRHIPLAFLIGEYAAKDSAAARVADLRQLDIPAYTVDLAGPPARTRVYAGGYAAPAEAAVMRQLLQAAGAPDSLVERLGKAKQ